MFRSLQSQADELFMYMKLVSDAHGGDEPEFLKAAFEDTLKTYQGALYLPIKCYKDIATGLMLITPS